MSLEIHTRDDEGLPLILRHDGEEPLSARRPSPWWVLSTIPLAKIATTMTLAPKIELYTTIACNDLAIMEGCASNPAIQVLVAQLNTAEYTAIGVLSVLTTALWASYSDRKGRTIVLAIAGCGMLLSDLVYILVSTFWKSLPGKYWLFVFGPVFEGALGGASWVVGLNAYVADTTSETDRPRILSMSLGMQFGAMALGPVVGSLAMKARSGLVSAFYAAALLHAAFIVCTWLIIPESLPAVRSDSKLHSRVDSFHTSPGQHLWYLVSAPFKPLGILLPTVYGSGSRDWSLLLLAASFGFLYLISADVPYKFIYAAAHFGWSAKENSSWLSVAAAVRALWLLAVLPWGLSLIKNKPRAPRCTTEPTANSEPYFLSDIALAKRFLIAEVVAYATMLMWPSAFSFYAVGILGAIGAGFPPLIESVMLSVYERNYPGQGEVGRLLGALGVVQTLSAQLISPPLYGFVYITAVRTYPPAIFATSLTAFVLSFVVLSLGQPSGRHSHSVSG